MGHSTLRLDPDDREYHQVGPLAVLYVVGFHTKPYTPQNVRVRAGGCCRMSNSNPNIACSGKGL